VQNIYNFIYILVSSKFIIFNRSFIHIISLIYYWFRKYVYTINHKRIALNYLYFSLFTSLAGTSLATMIRFELAYPGSHFFKGDSIKYLQVITAHGLVMIFFVTIPILFGFFANFFIPYHIGSKDVAFPRLNSLGFWIQPSGFFLLSRVSFFRPNVYTSSEYNDHYSWELSNITGSFINNLYWKYKLLTRQSSSILYHIDPHHLLRLPNLYKKSTSTKIHIPNLDDILFFRLKKVLYNQNNVSFFHLNRLDQNFMSFKNLTFRNIQFFPKIITFPWYKLLHFYNNDLVIYRDLNFVVCANANYVLSGWTFITPFSSKLKYTGLGSQDIVIVSILFTGVSTTISFTNLLITRRTLSMPGLRYRKSLIPFLSISLFLSMRMLTLITPVLGAAMLMLFCDRHFNTSFFDYAYGGDVILFHHLFWFFGHPEVYVVIIPAFGIVNMLIPFYTRRRIASKNHLIWATYIMGYMGFLVWGHHMYLIGLDHRSRSLYSTITVMISLPAVVKIVNWTLTYINSTVVYDLPLFFIFSFFLFFLCGGLTGMWLSHVGLNTFIHDTFYVVAHFHFLFSSSTFSAIFAGLYYYFNIIFNQKYNRPYGYLHFFYWTCGQWLTFLPLFWVGYNGLPRRYHDYPTMFSGWQGLSTTGHVLNLISVVLFFILLIESTFYSTEPISVNYQIPRFYKRIHFLLFKITYKHYLGSKIII